MIRTFKIKNAAGEERTLLSRSGPLLIDPDGLGWEEETEFFRAGSMFVPMEEYFKQKEITGTIIIRSYQMYRDFTKFLRRTPLILSYQTEKETVYKLGVKATRIEKGEKNEFKVLECDVTFTALGRFYREITGYSESTVTEGKKYSYVYPYTYSKGTANTIVLTSDSIEESPCRITIYGPVEAPVWRHYVNNVLKESGAYSGTIQDGRCLEIDTTKIPYSIIEKDLVGNVVADRYQLCDFSTQRFMFLYEGENRFSISQSGPENVALKVEARLEYETV